MKLLCLTVLLPAILIVGCRPQTANTTAATSPPPAPKIANLPAELTLKQRSTTPVPGAAGKLSVTVDDITRGQTMVSLLDDKQQAIMGPVSLSQGESSTFAFDGHDYVIELTQLDNALIGDDFATLVIRDPASGTLSEQQKIERLILAIEGLEGAVFLRNGAEHTPREAIEHLRTKLDAAGNRITTAEQFIEHLGSKSSISGEPYEIKLKDGTVVPAGEFLREKLAEIEAKP